MADTPPRHDYLPIADHGIIGDLHSAALVGTDGTIDWYCHDRFDAPSVFGAILDAERGGFFRLTPIKCQWTSKQLYVPDTNVLITRFLSQDGVGEVVDFMPVDDRQQGTHHQRLVRRVLCVKGALHFSAEVEPRFDYGRADADIAVTDDGAVFASPDLTLSLSARVPLERTEAGVRATFVLDQGQSATFVLEQGDAAATVLRGRHARALQRDGRLLAALDLGGALPGTVARDRAALRADAEAPDVPAVRRAHRRRDHEPPRAARRRAQLGLPLHVDPRRRVLPLRAAAARASRRRPRRSAAG